MADDVPELPSEDDQDHGLDHDLVNGDEPEVEAGGLTEDLKRKIIKQVSPFLFFILLFKFLLHLNPRSFCARKCGNPKWNRCS